MTVMLIDDNEIARFISLKAIEEVRQIRTTIPFASCEEALDYLQENKFNETLLPDLILLDLYLPGMDGLSFLDNFESLRNEIKKEVCICILSASIRIKLVKAHDHLVSSFIVKPITSRKLNELLLLMKRSVESLQTC